MKVRDRLVVAVILAVVVVGAVWVLLVSPERSQVSSLSAQIAAEQATLATAQSGLASARQTATHYVDDVHAISQVASAVPPSIDEPAIISLITKLAGGQVDFHSITVGGANATAGGPIALGLTFTFHATYNSLQSFLDSLDRLAATDGTNIAAQGRLVTVASVALTPIPPKSTSATVTAFVYSQGAAAAPTGATGGTGATGTVQTTSVTP